LARQQITATLPDEAGVADGRRSRRRILDGAVKIFLDYTREEIDHAYDQSVWAPNADEVRARTARLSAAARGKLDHRTGIPYGDAAAERLDFFPAAAPNAPVVVFIHGGAWKLSGTADYCAAAETFVRAGVNYIVLDFACIPAVRLPDMVEQVRSATAWVYRNAAGLGIDRERIYVTGHSSGAHLAGCVLVTDWRGEHDLPGDIVKGGLCMSGMYELAPVMLSARSAYLRLSEAEVERYSAQRHLDRLHCPVLVAHGGDESPEFQRQARDFAAALRPIGKLADFLPLPGVNHFEMALQLANSDSAVARAVFRLMGLPQPNDGG
jgi:arylformamidase